MAENTDFSKTESEGMRLAGPKRGLFHFLYSRTVLIALLLLIQIFVFLLFVLRFREYLPHYSVVEVVISVTMAVYLFGSDMDTSGKLTWMMLIGFFPAAGSVMLWFSKTDIGHRALKARCEDMIGRTRGVLRQDPEILAELERGGSGTDDLARYMNRSGCFPVYKNTQVEYFPLGEDKLRALIPELEKAEKFIFLEYFIIGEGYMWGTVLVILARKAREGVDVRLLYDGTCEFTLLPHDYPKRLAKLGIQAKIFSPLTPFLSTYFNYRDHRKILVIDGKVAFTGGINLSDEYINRASRFGHWKDTAILLRGDAALSFTLMFLQMWNLETPRQERRRLKGELPELVKIGSILKEISGNGDLAGEEMDAVRAGVQEVQGADGAPEDRIALENRAAAELVPGFVCPYSDCPLDDYRVGESVYIDMLYRATDYVHIMTPYLILDGELENALKFAAERGVDVRILLPGIPDKKIAYSLAKAHYPALLRAGVRIYEYTPGFVHAKVVVSDACKAVVGTINFDYRSLYHHFECASYLYQVPCIADIEADFQDTLAKCREITPDNLRESRRGYRLIGSLMRLFAPMM